MEKLIILSYIVWTYTQTVQAITFTPIGNVVKQDIFFCGEKILLMCSAETNRIVNMKFTLNDVQVAACLITDCKKNPDFGANFSMDYASGTFNFTLDPVTGSHDGQNFSCSINGVTTHIVPKVVEPPKTQSITFDFKPVSSGTEIKAITGCVFPKNAIEFKWFTIKDSNRSDIETYLPTNNVTHQNDSLCVSNCNGTVLSNGFIINEEGILKRTNVIFEVHVIHRYSPDHFTVVQRTTRIFNITDPLTTTTAKTTLPTDSTTLSTTSSPKTSTSSLPSSTTDNITTYSSTVTSEKNKHGTTKKQNADETSTILIASFSSIGGIGLLLITLFIINKSRKKHNRQSEERNMHAINHGINKNSKIKSK